jgi:hypothetical protein
MSAPHFGQVGIIVDSYWISVQYSFKILGQNKTHFVCFAAELCTAKVFAMMAKALE